MKYVWTSCLIAGSLAASAPSQKDMAPPTPVFFQKYQSQWYVGAGVSFADLFVASYTADNTFSSAAFSDHGSEDGTTVSAPSLGYNAFFGYLFNKYLSLEAKVLQIVRPLKEQGSLNDSFRGGDILDSAISKRYLLSFGPYVLIHLPISSWCTPFFRFGMVTTWQKTKESAKINIATQTAGEKDSATYNGHIWTEKFNVGMGFRGTWKDMFSLSVEYETPLSHEVWTNGNTIPVVYVLGTLSASVRYQF